MFKMFLRSKAAPDTAKRKATPQKRGPIREVWDKTTRFVGTLAILSAIAFIAVNTMIGVTSMRAAEARLAEARLVEAQTRDREAAYKLQNRATEALAYKDPGKRPASASRRSNRKS